MFGLDLIQIAEKIQGQLLQGEGKVCPLGAAIDTRKLKKGDLFFALPGTKTDGHSFLKEAQEKGACAAIISRVPEENLLAKDLPLILVQDSEKALQQLAQAQRQLFSGPVIAITGSTGKTTTKDMLGAILSEKGPVLSTTGNYNNQLGLPLTILSLEANHWAIVTEMGMRNLGDIDFLAVIARPTHGIITNIGHTHQEILGSQEKIAQAKAELISHIPVTGAMALNIEDKKLLKAWLSNLRCPVQWFAYNPPADIWIEDIVLNQELSYSYRICSQKGSAQVTLNIPGRHNILNSLAAAAIASQLGLSFQETTRGLAQVNLSPMRLEKINIPEKDWVIINDTYNANPVSMCSALEVLTTTAGKRRTIAVLGDMYELGDYSETGHRLVGKKAKEQDIAYLITVGQLARQIAEAAKMENFPEGKIKSCQNNQEAVSYLRDILRPGDVILLKGSRGVKMEEIVRHLSRL